MSRAGRAVARRQGVADILARLLNRLVRPLGLRCVRQPAQQPAPGLPNEILAGASILPRRQDILPLLPKGGVVAEVGVAFGQYTRLILDAMQPRQFVAIDTFSLDEPTWFGRQPFREDFGDLSHLEYYRRRFLAEIEQGVMLVRPGYSQEVLAGFPDGHFDMIYIDAAHDYDSVSRDLALAGRKIRPDGHIIVNDYIMVDPLLLEPYGVVQATHEFCLREGWRFRYLALHPYMFCDVALVKR